MKKILIALVVILTLFLLLAGCSHNPGSASAASFNGPVTISNKADTEGSLLGQIIALMLQVNNFQVIVKPGVAGTELIRQALLSGDIDVYPEYTGNGAVFFKDVDPTVWKNAQQG
ncbi:MAG TPA: glycine betaine ABC transporter substrate-binding protein, partial [Dehalococcoidales bacterium]|nr:glycine betaine ABC transporter substrate-binding protein [Dehalococcoidales bacterium]